MDPNAPHSYGQMPMMGSYASHYYMSAPPHVNDGQYGNGAPSQIDSSSSSSYAAGSGLHPPPPPQMSYPPQSEQSSHPGYVRSSEQYSYPQVPPQNSDSSLYSGSYPQQHNNAGQHQHDRRW